jgi:hypothetical protein
MCDDSDENFLISLQLEINRALYSKDTEYLFENLSKFMELSGMLAKKKMLESIPLVCEAHLSLVSKSKPLSFSN